jgi:hypothetical protein
VTSVQLGRIDQARADIQALPAMQPGATVGGVKQYLDYLPNLGHYLDALRQSDCRSDRTTCI